MLAIRTARFAAAVFALILGTSTIALSATSNDEMPAVRGVVGAVELEAPTSLGTFAVTEGVHQHRDIPVSGVELFADDARLMGRLDAILNFDVHRSGKEPVPAWGTMTIADGAWTGTFTGMRRYDLEPFEIDAFLVGTGEYDGLCAVLDITARPDSWSIDGVIHPLPMDS